MPLGGGSTLGGDRATEFVIPKSQQHKNNPKKFKKGKSGTKRGKGNSSKNPANLTEERLKELGVYRRYVGAHQKLRSVLSGGGASPSSVLGG
jgi:hypothetical protein